MTTNNLNPAFDPARSAAIRDLLIETVEAAPSRRPTARFAMVATLTGIAVALAGGTAALALTGVLHLGAPAPAPAPAPTPTSTPTPAPSPTPTPTPTPAPIVQSGPIVPHDVDALAAQTRWKLDLPGADDGCTGTQAISLSDGRALYLTGIRPKEYEGSDCGSETHEDIAATLVDTSAGTKLWSREWTFDVGPSELRTTDLQILGTSGRAFIAYGSDDSGPHEVLDLRTGRKLAPYTLGSASLPRQDTVAVGDGSGDVITLRHQTDSNGSLVSDDVVSRVDPLTPDHPVWSITLPAAGASLNWTTLGSGVVALSGQWHDGWTGDRLVNAATGDLISGDEPFRVTYAMRDVLVDDDYQNPVSTVRGYDAQGHRLWERTFGPAASLQEVGMLGSRPGMLSPGAADSIGAGWFVVSTSSDVALVDESTGQDVWRVPLSTCGDGQQDGTPILDTVRAAIIVRYSTGTLCSYSLDSGSVISSGSYADQSIPGLFVGSHNLYGYPQEPYTNAGQPGSAWDLATGKLLWTLPRISFLTQWEFDGGYLVSRTGTHLESIG